MNARTDSASPAFIVFMLIGAAAALVKMTVAGEESFDWVKFAWIAGTAIVTVGGALLLWPYAREREVDEQPAGLTAEEARTRAKKWAIARCIAAFTCALALGWQMIAELVDHGVARPVHWAPYAILLAGTIGVCLKSVRALATDSSG